MLINHLVDFTYCCKFHQFLKDLFSFINLVWIWWIFKCCWKLLDNFFPLKISPKRWKTTDKKQKESRSNFNLEVQDKHKLCSSANPCKFNENWTNKIKSLSDFILLQKKLKQLKLNEISNFKRICNRLRNYVAHLANTTSTWTQI